MVTATEKLYTPEEFATLPDAMTDEAELVDGRIIKKRDEAGGMTPSILVRSLTITKILSLLGGFVHYRDLGLVLPLAPFLVGSNLDRVRRPDIAFVAGEIPAEPDAMRALVPTLAIEVIASNDLAEQVIGRMLDYLEAGVQLVWLVFPKSRHVWGFKAGKSPVFRPGDIITAEPVLPGFACPVDDLFPPPAEQE